MAIDNLFPPAPLHGNGWAAYDAKGRILHLRTGLTVVPYTMHERSWDCVVINGDNTYPRGSYNICVADDDLLAAEELTATRPTEPRTRPEPMNDLQTREVLVHAAVQLAATVWGNSSTKLSTVDTAAEHFDNALAQHIGMPNLKTNSTNKTIAYARDHIIEAALHLTAANWWFDRNLTSAETMFDVDYASDNLDDAITNYVAALFGPGTPLQPTNT